MNLTLELSYENKTKFVKKDGDVCEFTSYQKNALYLKLKEWRSQTAKSTKLLINQIFDDTMLVDFVNFLPISINMLWLIPNIDEEKITLYGNDVIYIIKNFLDNLTVCKVLYGKESLSISDTNQPIFGFLGLLNYLRVENKVKKMQTVPNDYCIYRKVKVGDTVKLEINNETRIYKIIKTSVSYKPVWRGSIKESDGYRTEIESNADPINDNTISDRSPLGIAIIGKWVGNSFDYQVGNKIFYGKIISVN